MDDPFAAMCERLGLGKPVPEYVFAPPRKWRFDYAWTNGECLALEVEGGIFMRGRHTRPKGFLADIEKYNTATICGWRVLRVTPQMMENGEVFAWLERALGRRMATTTENWGT